MAGMIALAFTAREESPNTLSANLQIVAVVGNAHPIRRKAD